MLILVFAVASSQYARAEKVTFINKTGTSIIVRCISPGNVSPANEYRETIPSGRSHYRTVFAPGLRVAVAWTADGKHACAQPFVLAPNDHGTELTVMQDPQSGSIVFGAWHTWPTPDHRPVDETGVS